jgi:hypothetical protein
MRCTKPPPIRNKIELSDATQLRTLKRRLGVSTADLQRLIEKVGNSISAVNKELQLERTPSPAPNTDAPTASSTLNSSTGEVRN